MNADHVGLVERLRAEGKYIIKEGVYPNPWEPDALCQRAADAIENLTAKLAEAKEGWHYANGTADLAMKHRDEAEAALSTARHDTWMEAAKVVEGIYFDGGGCHQHVEKIAAALRSKAGEK
jgi:hypothetical protein